MLYFGGKFKNEEFRKEELKKVGLSLALPLLFDN